MNSKEDLLLSPQAHYNKVISEREKEHALLIRTAIRETAEAMAVLTPEQIITKQHEYAALLAHLQRLQDLENAVLGMVTVQAKGE